MWYLANQFLLLSTTVKQAYIIIIIINKFNHWSGAEISLALELSNYCINSLPLQAASDAPKVPSPSEGATSH